MMIKGYIQNSLFCFHIFGVPAIAALPIAAFNPKLPPPVPPLHAFLIFLYVSLGHLAEKVLICGLGPDSGALPGLLRAAAEVSTGTMFSM